MAVVVDMKGSANLVVDGMPFKYHLKVLQHWHEELAKQVEPDTYLEVKTKVGWVEFHFNEERYE